MKSKSTNAKPRGSARARRSAPILELDGNTDLREQLFNGGAVGSITDVSTPAAMITSLRGLMLDLDLKMFRKELLDVHGNTSTPFYRQLIRPMLEQNPVLRKAEVRDSGTGLHIILRFDEPVELRTESEQERWANIVRVVQRLLPSDPHCPGITATTRPVGSINSKNGKTVRQLAAGKPVTAAEVIDLFNRIRRTPCRTLAEILFGGNCVQPCPICRKADTAMRVMDHVGKCCNCGQLRIAQLFDVFLAPHSRKEVGNGKESQAQDAR